MSSVSNEVLEGPYFSFTSMYSNQPEQLEATDFENSFWGIAYDHENLKSEKPVKENLFNFNAGEIFSSELVKNTTLNHSNPFWGLISFQDEKIDDTTSSRELQIENLDEWLSIPFGGIFASYPKEK